MRQANSNVPNYIKVELLIPTPVLVILQTLRNANYQAYIVGGCVRDLLQNKKPDDWDITTNARPEAIQTIFPESFYENTFGTVTVKTDDSDKTLREIQITPFRLEARYSNKRHPDEIIFTQSLEDDLKRRDFSVNALAIDIIKNTVIDLFNGQQDLQQKLIRAVGQPQERFSEDALRLMRAVRFAVTLGFAIESNTRHAIYANAELIKLIAPERIRDELLKIIQYTPIEWMEQTAKRDKPSSELTEQEYKQSGARGFELMRELGLLKYILPELEAGFDISQNKHHTFTVWEHNLKSFAYGVKENFNWQVRMAALLHDVAKPYTKRGEGPDSTFYGHDVVGAKMTRTIMRRLRFSKNETERVTKFVRHHLFQSDPERITDSAVRRIVRNVGKEDVWDLMRVRLCDRIGSGVPKAEPYRLRSFYVMLERALREPVSLKQLKINGDKLMLILNIEPGPKVGYILNALMNEVLDDPVKNTSEYLEKLARELYALEDKELAALAKEARHKMEQIEYRKEEAARQKYWID